MGQAKKNRSIGYALELADKRLRETTNELIRRDHENAAAAERLSKEGEHVKED